MIAFVSGTKLEGRVVSVGNKIKTSRVFAIVTVPRVSLGHLRWPQSQFVKIKTMVGECGGASWRSGGAHCPGGTVPSLDPSVRAIQACRMVRLVFSGEFLNQTFHSLHDRTPQILDS